MLQIQSSAELAILFSHIHLRHERHSNQWNREKNGVKNKTNSLAYLKTNGVKKVSKCVFPSPLARYQPRTSSVSEDPMTPLGT